MKSLGRAEGLGGRQMVKIWLAGKFDRCVRPAFRGRKRFRVSQLNTQEMRSEIELGRQV